MRCWSNSYHSWISAFHSLVSAWFMKLTRVLPINISNIFDRRQAIWQIPFSSLLKDQNLQKHNRRHWTIVWPWRNPLPSRIPMRRPAAANAGDDSKHIIAGELGKLWLSICDITGNPKLWPRAIRKLMWKTRQYLTYGERFRIILFFETNGVNSKEMIFPWFRLRNMIRDVKTYEELNMIIQAFENPCKTNSHWRAWDVRIGCDCTISGIPYVRDRDVPW